MELDEIIQGCIDNNRKTQSTLYKLYYTKMVSVANKYSNGSDDVEDLIQESFINIFNNIHRFKGNTLTSLCSWMCTIVKNKTMDMHRKNKNFKYVQLPYDLFTESEAESFYDLFVDDIPLLINSLSPQHKKVVTMFYLEDKKHLEISKILGISLSSSKSTLLRSKMTMKKTLSKLHPSI